MIRRSPLLRRTVPLWALVVMLPACTDSPAAVDDPPAALTTGVPASSPATSPEGDAGPDSTVRSFAGSQPAVDFPAGLDWLNTGGELSLPSLRGKAVLLDFWTYGCINCIHILPDLERLEEEFADELVVIGVHSAKFPNEGQTENIRQIILRYGIEHPVVNDRDFAVWNQWRIGAWPTVVLIDPAGNIVGTHAGEGVYDVVAPVVASLISEFDARGQVDRSPLDVALEAAERPRTVLSFPGKVLADPTGTRLVIADSGHHRVVVADPGTGEVLEVVGSGEQGFRDGPSGAAQFDSPQGLAFDPQGDAVFVADTNNHAIRRIDLASGDVTTVAGTGAKGWPPRAGPALETDLNSPWHVVAGNGRLYIAMAGTHQVWSLDLDDDHVGPLVGNGRESTKNGPLADAELAQPSGLALTADGTLYIADAESSSIRSAQVTSDTGITATVAGSDRGLFEFGAQDGIGTEARFQHPLGVAVDTLSGELVVADTYNSRLRRIDVETGTVTTWLGSEAGWADGTDPRFNEPGGLSIAADAVFVADTNNHVIRRVDLATGETSTLVLRGIERFQPVSASVDNVTVIELDQVATGPGPGTFVLDVRLPAEHKLNEDAPSVADWTASTASVGFPSGDEQDLTGAALPAEFAADFTTGAATVTADVTLIYCRDGAESLCFIEQVRFVVPVEVAADGPSPRLVLAHTVGGAFGAERAGP